MMAEPPTAKAGVPPVALGCSSHSVLPTRPARLVLRLALAAGVARKPVSKAPSVPPTPCTPKVSSASSYLNHALSLVQARKGTTPARTPINTAPPAVTKPAAGVTTTRPATAPEQKPSTGGLPRVIHSSTGPLLVATAVARVVAGNAPAAVPPAASALAAVKPCH